MAQFVQVPPERLEASVLRALLEEYTARDGTDYGTRELSLDEKVARLQSQLDGGDLLILFDLDAEQWDLVTKEQAQEWLHN